MATAARGAVGFIPETPEEQRALDNLRASRQALQNALLNRQELFDPALLAIAQGFLAPTKSGGFGESLGNVAAQLGPVQQKERERELQMFQIRAELAAQQMAEAQATRGERQFQSLIRQARGEGAPAAPAAGAQPSAQGAPSAAQPAAGQAGFRALDPLDVVALGRLPGQAEGAKALMDAIKLERDRFILDQQTGRVFDKSTQSFLPATKIPFEKQEKYTIGDRTYSMAPSEFDEYRAARAQG